jgi:hypothetical protein
MSLLEKIEKTKYGYKPKISDMIGVTFTDVEHDDFELMFYCAEGVFRFTHHQDCCEHVAIQDITGDIKDLIGEPLLLAEESTGETPADIVYEEDYGSHTWTFYKFATRKGYVDVRWLGESNGFYSESVDLEFEATGEKA